MGSKTKIAILIPGLLAIMLLLISSDVVARDLKEGEAVKETNEVEVGDAKLIGGGGPFPGGIGGYDYGQSGGGGRPTYEFTENCEHGCCFRLGTGDCLSCCPASG